MVKRSVIGAVPANEPRRDRVARRAVERDAIRAGASARPLTSGPELAMSKMPKIGFRGPENWRGRALVTPPTHGASTKIVGAAYPFVAETGMSLPGPYIGDNMLSRAPFCLDQWEAYALGIIRSHSVAIIGVKGSGKSMLAKSWATRLIRVGRQVAVPHDPNGEWVKVARFVGGKSISIGPGKAARINLLDEGQKDPDMSDESWRHALLQDRRATIKTVINRLRESSSLESVEHTALDVALEQVSMNTTVTLPMVFDKLLDMQGQSQDVVDAGRYLAHTLRRTVHGDLQGLFDGPSTVEFDSSAPMMVVDTSALKHAGPEAAALSRLATSRWIRRATSGGNRVPRVIVHEEAAVELLNDVYGGSGLTDKISDEKTARHQGTSHFYLLHRIADLDALGDQGSAVHSQALGLLADCDTRVSYAQHTGELARSSQVLGWNAAQAAMVRKLNKGEGMWQIGPDRLAKVKNVCTEGERRVFQTDQVAGERE